MAYQELVFAKMKKWRCPMVLCLGVAVVWLGGGCASVGPVTEGSQVVGLLEPAATTPPLAVGLGSSQVKARRGDPILFDVEIRNASSDPVWLPKDPVIVLVWTYPTGQRDNTMMPMATQVSLGPDKLLQLQPGETITRQVTVSTRYFPRLGVSKFQAIVQVPSNTIAPALPAGRFASNRFGVFVTE